MSHSDRHEPNAGTSWRTCLDLGFGLTLWIAHAVPLHAENPGGSAGLNAGGTSAAAEAAECTLREAIAYAKESRAALGKVRDYSAVFSKVELVNDQRIEQSMEIKFRREPFGFYLHNRNGKEEGREVLYIDGQNNGKLLVHEKGLLASLAGNVSLNVDDKQVMSESRYPVSDLGIHRILEKALAVWEADLDQPEGSVLVQRLPNWKVGNMACTGFQITYRDKRSDTEFYTSRVIFEKQSKLPVHVERFDWPAESGGKPPLLEQYSYTDIRTNVGLTDQDFDPANPTYHFGKDHR